MGKRPTPQSKTFRVNVRGAEYAVKITDGVAVSVRTLPEREMVWQRGTKSPSRSQWTAISEALRTYNRGGANG